MVRRNPFMIFQIILAGLLIIFFTGVAQSAKKKKAGKTVKVV